MQYIDLDIPEERVRTAVKAGWQLLLAGKSGKWTTEPMVGPLPKPFILDRSEEGVRTAAKAGWELLLAGKSAVEAVEAAVVELEDNPVFDAG